MPKKTKTMQKLGPMQQKWLRALESGRYKQCQGYLKRGDCYCCLGIACTLAKIRPKLGDNNVYTFKGNWEDLPPMVQKAFAFRDCTGESSSEFCPYTIDLPSLATLNDERKFDFAKIAAIVRAFPERYFTKPK